MGFFGKAKADNQQSYAQKAWDAGDPVYIVQIRAGWTHSNDLSRPIPDMAGQVAAIESVGWRLDQHTFVDSDSKATLYCIFRR